MLANILKTKVAEEISIRIMAAFVVMRHYIPSSLIEQKYINDLVLEDHEKIKVLETSFQKFEEKRKVNEIYFQGQIYNDSYRDRYIIIDRKIFYHCGTSINYAGSRTISINILDDKIVRKSLLNDVLNKINLINN